MSKQASTVTIALSSIPNTGKTTLFNRLTGASQSTGNWPGVSVQKKTGHFTLGEYSVDLVDLPGAYAMSPVTEEETVVRDYFLQTPPDVILNLLDARNLYRGLGLTLQMAASGLPMVVAVNMMDEAEKLGIALDIDALSSHLGVPVIPISARSGAGIPELEAALYQVIQHPERTHPPHISCPPVLENAVEELARRIEKSDSAHKLDHSFMAMRLLEEKAPGNLVDDPAIAATAHQLREKIEENTGTELPITCANCRFNAARGLVLEATHAQPLPVDTRTDRIDHLLLHPWFGLPIFLLAMLVLFQAIYGLGTPLQDWLANGFDAAEAGMRGTAVAQALPGWLQSLLFDGIWQGVGVVTSFFPILALFFIFMSLIEDSGYMARAAFLMDRLMHRLDLDGKTFINLLLGFGCNVPAVMGTRILSGAHSRIVTMLLIPFTLCSARLQVFVFLISILFSPRMAPWVLFFLYFSSFIAIILVGLFLKAIKISNKPEPFIMEIPPYRLPTARSVALRSWHELRHFLKRAGTMIILGVIAVWFLTHLPTSAAPASADTWAGQLGQFFSPLFAPLGIGWRETIALVFGFIAKEIVIGAMAVIYGGAELSQQISAHFTPLQGLSFMVFTLLYTPCVATVSAIRAESHSWKITLLSVTMGFVVAWLAAVMVYQTGRLLGF
ncbi:MAG TPA: ferrous iron transport protein B [Gammaproteobacteria bacterium]|nr:ferrous iron transport protein B [Gammaproteobacteria bacterium]